MKNNNEKNWDKSRAFEKIRERANELAAKLKVKGWQNSPDNPENELIIKKDCSSCGKEIIEHLTITAPAVKDKIGKLIEDSANPIKCLGCEMKEKEEQKEK